MCQITFPTTASASTQWTYCILQVQIPGITSNGHPREESDDVIVGLRGERQNVKHKTHNSLFFFSSLSVSFDNRT